MLKELVFELRCEEGFGGYGSGRFEGSEEVGDGLDFLGSVGLRNGGLPGRGGGGGGVVSGGCFAHNECGL